MIGITYFIFKIELLTLEEKNRLNKDMKEKEIIIFTKVPNK